jgi:TolB protein
MIGNMGRNREVTFYRHALLASVLAASSLSLSARQPPAQQSPALGLFEGQTEVGTLLHAGSGEFDSASDVYTVTGGGDNMWAIEDDFHFVWKKMTGDVGLSADIALPGEGGDHHRKAVLMIRQNLDADSPYADVAVHGDGLTSLQYREEKGAATHEIESYQSAPSRVRIEKHGDRFYMFVGPAGEQPQFAGGSIRVILPGPFYVGIGVCAHNKDAIQKAVFTHVGLDAASGAHPARYSTIQTITVASTDARVSYVGPEGIKSPSWGTDGGSILFDIAHKTQQVAAAGGKAETAEAELPESFGQEHSPDGRFIYMNSNRTGTMQLWRTAADGSGPEQLTHDDANNAYPHLSADGKQLVFLTYVTKYILLPDETDVTVRVLSLTDNKLKVLAKISGGPNTLGAQPWSPDSKRLTFVSYQSIP